MTEVKIRLQQTDQVKKLVDFLTPCPYEVNLVSGRYTIDAKSLLGIYSLDLSNPLTLVIYTDDCDGLLPQLRAPGWMGEIACPHQGNAFAACPPIQVGQVAVPAGRPGKAGVNVKVCKIHGVTLRRNQSY